MSKKILLTGATDGIGLETAKRLVSEGHNVVVHGRSATKLASLRELLGAMSGGKTIDSFEADLSRMSDVFRLSDAILSKYDHIDVLINNAGVFKVTDPLTVDGLDVRFAVNTIAPYLLTKRLRTVLPRDGRVINVSSAAQAPVNTAALVGKPELEDYAAYAQSKLALTMWTRHLVKSTGQEGPMIVSVNPGSLLATKMVKEGFGMEGADVQIGVDILYRAALSDEFTSASGMFYDNDSKQFAPPHPDALDPQKNAEVVRQIEHFLATFK